MKLTILFEQLLLQEDKLEHIHKTYKEKLATRMYVDDSTEIQEFLHGWQEELYNPDTSEFEAPDGFDDMITMEVIKMWHKVLEFNTKHLVWIIRQYCKEDFLFEDHPRVKEAVTRFEEVRRRLEKKDLMTYTTLDELERAIEDLDPSAASKRQQRQKIKLEGVEKIHEDDVWVALKLLTKEAAMYYGKGTRWCTAAENNNMFDAYSKRGPLFVLINKQTNRKFQFHAETHQYMDERDHRLSVDDYREFVKYPAVVKFLVKHGLIPTLPSTHLELFTREDMQDAPPELIERYLTTVVAFKQRSYIQFKELTDRERATLLTEPRIAFKLFEDGYGAGVWPELEDAIIEDKEVWVGCRYFKLYKQPMGETRWPEYERMALALISRWNPTGHQNANDHITASVVGGFHRHYVQRSDRSEQAWPEYETLLIKKLKESEIGMRFSDTLTECVVQRLQSRPGWSEGVKALIEMNHGWALVELIFTFGDPDNHYRWLEAEDVILMTDAAPVYGNRITNRFLKDHGLDKHELNDDEYLRFSAEVMGPINARLRQVRGT